MCPYYAARSLLRMFIALGLSTVFTLVYGTAAARLRRAEKVLVPILDVLQSIPILVFLPIALTFFIKIFPEQPARPRSGLDLRDLHLAGLEHDLQLLPLAHLPAHRARRGGADVPAHQVADGSGSSTCPSSMIGLVWNMMMSMGGGWFFLTASEAVTVFIKGKGISESLPGMGSYMAAAIAHGSYTEVAIAIVVMVILVVGTNFFVFRPLVAWSDKFRLETSEATEKPKSVVLDILRRSFGPRAGRPCQPPSWTGAGPGHPAVRAGRVPAADRSA